jgi:hypothetical protein
MSLNKSIQHGKEKRKPYHSRGKHVRSCRPNGGCPYCLGSRTHSLNKRLDAARSQLEDR